MKRRTVVYFDPAYKHSLDNQMSINLLWCSSKALILLEGQGNLICKIWNLPDIIRTEMGKKERNSFFSLSSYKETISPCLSCCEVYGQLESCNWWLIDWALRQQVHWISRYVLIRLWCLCRLKNNEFLYSLKKNKHLPPFYPRQIGIFISLRPWKVSFTHLMLVRWELSVSFSDNKGQGWAFATKKRWQQCNQSTLKDIMYIFEPNFPLTVTSFIVRFIGMQSPSIARAKYQWYRYFCI